MSSLLLVLLFYWIVCGFNLNDAFQTKLFKPNSKSLKDPENHLRLQSGKNVQSTTNLKGYYVRPSRAIEKGGGFYVPGFEGGKIRIFTSMSITLLSIANTVGVPLNSGKGDSISYATSTLIGAIACVILLLQGLLDEMPSIIRQKTVSDTHQNTRPYFTSVATSSNTESVAPSIENTSRAIVQTVPGILHLSVSHRDVVNGSRRIIYEISRIVEEGLSPTSIEDYLNGCKDLRTPPNGNTSTVTIDQFDVESRPLSTLCPPLFPLEVATVIKTVVTLTTGGARGPLDWIIAFDKPSEALASKDIRWMQSLVSFTSTPTGDL